MELAEPNMDTKPEDTENTRWLWNPLAEDGPKWVEVTLEEIEAGRLKAEEMQRLHTFVPDDAITPSDIVS